MHALTLSYLCAFACPLVSTSRFSLQHQLLELDRSLEDGEQQLNTLKASSSTSPYLHTLINSQEAELDRLCFSHSAHTVIAERLCADEVSEAELVRWAEELYESKRQSHEICWRELEERRDRRSSHALQHSNGTARAPALQEAHPINTVISAKKRKRAEPKQQVQKVDKLPQRRQQQRQQSPISSPAQLSAFQLPPLAHFAFPAEMIKSLVNGCSMSNNSPHSGNHSSSTSSSPALSSFSSPIFSSPAASDVEVEEIADGGDDEENEGEDEEDALEPPAPPYNTPYLLPPVPSFSDRRTTPATLLTFSHPLPLSHYSIHCLPIPQPYMPPSSWPPLAHQAYSLLCQMNRDGGRGSSNGYYLLLVAASSLLVSASYFTLTEDSVRYTLAVNCFCTRKEMQGRGCGRVLYEAIRELCCRLSQWMRLTRAGSSGCQLIVHTVPATEEMWQTRFGLRRMEKGRDSGGGYTNTIALIDGRRGTEDRRREWVERIVHCDAVTSGTNGTESGTASQLSERAVPERILNGLRSNGRRAPALQLIGAVYDGRVRTSASSTIK